MFFDRELSWLSFNHRVLQEAGDPQNPLFERIKFLAIYSSNLDEFFRVRVALYQQLERIEKKQGGSAETSKILKKIRSTVIRQQDLFGKIFTKEILPELKKQGIRLINHTQVNDEQRAYLISNFKDRILELSKPISFEQEGGPFLRDRELYFFARATDREKPRDEHYYFIPIPSLSLERFVELPAFNGNRVIIILDEVVRFFFPDLFPAELVRFSYEVKMSRDAELYLEDEPGQDMVRKIINSLPKRKTGNPSRLLYDSAISKAHVKVMRKSLGLNRAEMIPGGPVHNFNDLFSFPIGNDEELCFEPQEPLSKLSEKETKDLFKTIAQKDVLLHFPYEQYDPVISLLEEAAVDPQVESIFITIYRVAKESRVCKALAIAAKNGKEVLVFNEVKARFDEESNIYWGKELEKAGAKLIYSFEHLKVHSKVFLIKRKENGSIRRYSYLGTGNFNEKTSLIYADHALLTKSDTLGRDLERLFDFLRDQREPDKFNSLLVAPFNMREGLNRLIDFEISKAQQGKKAEMTLKMNSLEDKKMIRKLYEASKAGVKVKIIVRGICCLIPGIKGMSENIEVISIVDRYLEHARIWKFYHGGRPMLFLASADWMKRNLSKRIEVGFPVRDAALKAQINHLLDLQLADNHKGRKINKTQSNSRIKGKRQVRSQRDFYRFLRDT